MAGRLGMKNEDILLKRLYQDGKSRNEIAKIMGINLVRVSGRITVLKLASERVQGCLPGQVLAMLSAGYSVSDVAETFGVTVSKVVEIKKNSLRGRLM